MATTIETTTETAHDVNMKRAEKDRKAALDAIMAPERDVNDAPIQHPLVDVIAGITPEEPTIPEELVKALTERYPGAVWMRLDEIDFLTEAQIRGSQVRDGKEFAEIMRENPFTLPPGHVVRRPAEGDYAHISGKNNPFVAADIWKRAAACKIRGWIVYPCYIHECPSGVNPADEAVWIAAEQNQAGRIPDPMTKSVRELAAARMIRAGKPKAEIAARLGLVRQSVYNMADAAWTRDMLLRLGGNAAALQVYPQDALLLLHRMIASDDDKVLEDTGSNTKERRRIQTERAEAAVRVVNAGYKAKDIKDALGGWHLDHNTVHNIAENGVAPKTTGTGTKTTGNGGKSGPKVTGPGAVEMPNTGQQPTTPAAAPTEPHVPQANYDVDPAHKFGAVTIAILHGETPETAEVVSDVIASKFTVKQIESVIKFYAGVRDGLVKAEAEAAKSAAEADGAKVA